MPDDVFGTAVSDARRPDRKLTDGEQRSLMQRVEDCLDYPLLYEVAEHLPAPSAVGCPREYPPIIYLMMAALAPVTKSKRSAAGLLTTDTVWRALRTHIRRHIGRHAAANLPPEAPSRGQYLYAEANLLIPCLDLLEAQFRHYAVQQALCQGLFPADTAKIWSRPERRQLLVGDATVPRAPSKSKKPETNHPETGEILTHRVDPAARQYYESGEKKKAVRGTKWFFASGRDHGYWRRVILSFGHVAGGEYEDEAAVAVRHFSELKAELPDCMGVVYDGAFRGVHRDVLARIGMLTINKQHGSVAPVFYDHFAYGRCRHGLWCDQGRIAERIAIDDGTKVLQPVPVTRLEHRLGLTKSRWYHLLDIPCRHGSHEHRVRVGITSTPPGPERTGRPHGTAPQERHRTRLPPRRIPPADPSARV
ncbi:hypothetical protein ACQFX6_17360 [Streptomyces sp. DSM 41987]|uniref:hypothetical protein n=1 Tax=Streptomyces TaxID=1883 RepID=UPI00361CE930